MADFELPKTTDGHLASPLNNVVEAQELLFDSLTIGSPLSDWAKLRAQDFGETVRPRHLYVVGKEGKPHVVAWLQRSGLNLETGEPYSFYHVACDCMPEAEMREEPEMMFSCEGLGKAIVRRAKETRDFYGLPVILPVSSEEKMGSGGKQIVVSTLLYILERDQLHPETWVANYFNGRHELPILSVVFNRDNEELVEYAKLLEETGVIEVENDTTIRLSQAA
jgi:hypothetical protein